MVRGSGTPLVLLHGFPLDHTMWDAQLDPFAHRCQVIAPDQRGFGRTPLGRQSLTIEALADDVAALLDAMHIRDRVVICGLSMGGYVALAFQRKYATRVRALILCDTRANADTPAGAADRIALIERVHATGSVAVVDTMLSKLVAAPACEQQPHVVERVRQMMLGTAPATMVAALRALATRPDATNHLPHITVPTLTLVGEHDVITPVEVMHAMADAIPNCQRAVIPGAGHMSPMERPAEFTTAVLAFLKQPGVLH
jgi:pimeloyl-ACP methyl ester carboxylesterase